MHESLPAIALYLFLMHVFLLESVTGVSKAQEPLEMLGRGSCLCYGEGIILSAPYLSV